MAKEKDKAQPAEVEAVTKFPIEKLRQNCLALFGVTTSTFDGATLGYDGEYSVDEIKKAIDKWQNTKIKKEAN